MHFRSSNKTKCQSGPNTPRINGMGLDSLTLSVAGVPHQRHAHDDHHWDDIEGISRPLVCPEVASQVGPVLKHAKKSAS